MQRQSYVRNAAILTATGLLLRAIGMFFRVYIAARIGAEGMGLYQLIYTVCIRWRSHLLRQVFPWRQRVSVRSCLRADVPAKPAEP